jgi:hypothetical protein
MSNLEELGLYIFSENASIIDGYNLEENILNYVTKLKTFKFNISSVIPFNNQVNLPSNDEIQNTFQNFKTYKITSYINCFPKQNQFHCLIYSDPYPSTYYHNITNNFRGGLFNNVTEISLFDERPFEHEFFLQIAKSFPFITGLLMHNRESQKNDNQQCSIIEFPYLRNLDLIKTHENYLEQFLNNTKIHLLNNIQLYVDYNCLQRVTNNFTSDTTRINCGKVEYLILSNRPELSLDLMKDYFPHAEIY